MRTTIIIILAFVVGFLVGQATHIYTFNNRGDIRLNTITGDITTVGDLLRSNSKNNNRLNLSGLNLEK